MLASCRPRVSRYAGRGDGVAVCWLKLPSECPTGASGKGPFMAVNGQTVLSSRPLGGLHILRASESGQHPDTERSHRHFSADGEDIGGAVSFMPGRQSRKSWWRARTKTMFASASVEISAAI